MYPRICAGLRCLSWIVGTSVQPISWQARKRPAPAMMFPSRSTSIGTLKPNALMGRSPKTLEGERQIEGLIDEANQAEDLSPADQRLIDLIEDPAAHAGRSAFRPAARRATAKRTAEKPESESDPAYEEGLRR